MTGATVAGRRLRTLALRALAGLLILAPLPCKGPSAGLSDPDVAAAAVSAAPQAGPRQGGAARGPRAVTALGRLEPKDGILRIAGPSRPSVVITELLVKEGDRVRAGDPIAELDTRAIDEARAASAEAAVARARAELARVKELCGRGAATVAALEDARLALAAARADHRAARATLDMDTVRVPVSGQVLRILTHAGERVGPQGILELAQNQVMYAVAEVYETDVARIRAGQRAEVWSPALESRLGGTVERVGMQIGKLDTLDTDPVAAIDARVVEVHVKLDESRRAAPFANLQVYVSIAGRGPEDDAS